MQNHILPLLNSSKTIDTISRFIKNKLSESNSKEIVLGLSGGLDSSVVAYICTRAVGKEKILGLVLPSKTTSDEDVDDAVKVAKILDIKYKEIDIDPLIEPFPQICPQFRNSDLANANLKARIRMMLLYYHSNALNSLVAGTGNRTELLVGYFTKYGDGGVDILPIGDLYKTEVRKIAKYLGIPANIIEKAPTAGLWMEQTDEEELGIKYELLDKILYLMVDVERNSEEVSEMLKISHDEVLRVKEMIKKSEHKLNPPSIANIEKYED